MLHQNSIAITTKSGVLPASGAFILYIKSCSWQQLKSDKNCKIGMCIGLPERNYDKKESRIYKSKQSHCKSNFYLKVRIRISASFGKFREGFVDTTYNRID